VELSPPKNKSFSYFPGQFAFLSFVSRELSAEEHPFTISSTPTRPEALSFTIRSCGDWTQKINELKIGDSAFVDGPYGKFSFLDDNDQQTDIIMIAGGIGITPILSMLRYMVDTNETRKITLIWSNRTRQHIICEHELNTIQNRLPNFRIFYIFSRETMAGNNGRRLDRVQLQTFLKDSDRQAAVFLCGPLPFIKNIRNCLVTIGFAKKRIHWENFSL
jgi:predicted ferric reductase